MEAGFSSHAKYNDFLRSEYVKKANQDAERQAAAEERRLKEMSKRDSIRRSEMQKLREAQTVLERKKQEAVTKTFEAERRVQEAMQELQAAHTMQINASAEMSQFATQKEMWVLN